MNPTRILWSILAVLLLGFAVFEGVTHGWGATAVLVIAGILPDIALIGAFAGGGMLRPGRVAFYNAMHTPAFAVALAGIGIGVSFFAPEPVWLPVFLAGLAWLTHIAVDRAAGYGLRAADGSIRPVGGTAASTPCTA